MCTGLNRSFKREGVLRDGGKRNRKKGNRRGWEERFRYMLDEVEKKISSVSELNG